MRPLPVSEADSFFTWLTDDGHEWPWFDRGVFTAEEHAEMLATRERIIAAFAELGAACEEPA